MNKLKESDILKVILEYLALRPGKYWRQNTGAVFSTYKGKKRIIRFGRPGAADITGVRNGKRVEIEVKRPGEVQRDDQRAFEAMIKAEGGIYFVAKSVEDVQAQGF